jgi:hypothetical protein
LASHFLAFGNSDQESFRNLEVQGSFDFMTVPGTIASYYSEATAAFVLSSQLDYMIDPRTPLFQDDVAAPRASHFSLASWHGPAVRAALDEGVGVLRADFYTPDVVHDMVASIIERQRGYDENGSVVQKKLDRYAALLAEAMAQQGAPAPATQTKPPTYILAPYFAVNGPEDPWLGAQLEIWNAAGDLPAARTISPVVCVDGRLTSGAGGPGLLDDVLARIPEELSKDVFFWITDFDERLVGRNQLLAFWRAIEKHSPRLSLVNLYGSYFSICAQYAGLSGFGNGLTYSESRSWPALASTGAAPPRYYIPVLHGFLPVALAASLVDVDPFFRCDCNACSDWRDEGNTIASLPYHDLKRHFAVARRAELDFAESNGPASLAAQLRLAAQRLATARERVELSGLKGFNYLGEWAFVLEEVA